MRRTVIGLLALAFVLGGCSEVTTMTPADDEGQLEISVGERFELVLPGNPTTGYQWSLAESDPAIVAQQGEAEFVAESSLLGAAGEFHLTFEGMAPGTSTIRLDYERPFEEAEPLDTFHVTVVVS